MDVGPEKVSGSNVLLFNLMARSNRLPLLRHGAGAWLPATKEVAIG
jgi:hypothetical protein